MFSVLVSLASWLSAAFGISMSWFVGSVAQRLAMFAIFLGVVLAALNLLYDRLQVLASSLSTTVPDLGVFYSAVMPSNVLTFVTTFIAVETALFVYKWAVKLATIKLGN